MKTILCVLTFSLILSGTALTAPVTGPGAREISASSDIPELSGDFPQSCMMIRETTFLESGYQCSATIVSQNKAITAAHCAEGKTWAPVKLYCGGKKLEYTGILKPNAKYSREAGFTPTNINQDYGFITLDYGKIFSAAPMPYADSAHWEFFSSPDTCNCRIAGWGNNMRLFYAPVPELGNDDGVIFFGGDPKFLSGKNGINPNGLDEGDSGGTLMCKYGQTWYLVGVISAMGKNNMGAVANVMDFKN